MVGDGPQERVIKKYVFAEGSQRKIWNVTPKEINIFNQVKHRLPTEIFGRLAA